MDKPKQLFLYSLPLALGILLSYLFWRSSYWMLAIYSTIVLAVVMTGKDRAIEYKIFAYGIVAGVVVETIGTSVSGYQSFSKPDFWGIPYWLPVSWGYGFILMKRIGLIMATNSPWLNNND